MVINKNIWISAATKESKQLKNQGTCARASKEGGKQSGQTTDTIPKSWQQHIYIMRMEKMAFCLPHARIDQEENLSSRLLLILPCSKEGLLLHSCASHKVARLSQNVRKKEVGGIEAKNTTLGGAFYEQPSLWSWHEGQLEGRSTSSCRDANGCSACCSHVRLHTLHTATTRQRDSSCFFSEEGPTKHRYTVYSTRQCLVLFLLLNWCCFACRTTLWVAWESRKASRTHIELFMVTFNYCASFYFDNPVQ